MRPGAWATGLRGWAGGLESAPGAAGADRGAAYALRIEPNGKTQVRARAYDGSPVDLEFQTFPVATPLRRIDVTNVAPATRGSRVTPGANPASVEPLGAQRRLAAEGSGGGIETAEDRAQRPAAAVCAMIEGPGRS